MPDLTEADRDIILHSLGIKRPKQRWTSRNYYCADVNDQTEDDKRLARLEELGLVKRGILINSRTSQIFHVTRAGAEAVGVGHKVRVEDRVGEGWS